MAGAHAAAKVLVVDDDPDVRAFLRETLAALGFEADEAADGDAALAQLTRFEPDAIVLDFAMPGRNGAELARDVRRLKPDVPIIFATGFSDTEAIGAVEEKPCVLRKPFRIDELREALAKALGD
jgi:CheY-like chemotaxis protein